jgi:hypothetical protein
MHSQTDAPEGDPRGGDPIEPSAPTPAVLTATAALADGVAATLRVTRALVDSNRAVDLAGFDGMVGLLCARALDLPPEQGRVLRPRLVALRDDLDALAVALEPPP